MAFLGELMKKIILKLAPAAVLVLSASSAMALTPPPPPPGGAGPGPQAEHHMHKKSVTREEVLARAAKRFDQADTNKDGVLTRDEMRAQHMSRKGPPSDRKGPPPPHGDHKGPPPPGQGPAPAGQPLPAPVK